VLGRGPGPHPPQPAIKIPAGVDTGTRIQLAGKAEVGPARARPGDLYVEIVERPHPVFTRRGDDLHCTLEVPMTAAALGTTLELETLDGVEQVDVRPGTQSGEVQTLRGLGVTHLRGQRPRRPRRAHGGADADRLDEQQEQLLRDLARCAARSARRPDGPRPPGRLLEAARPHHGALSRR
jgi:molecular chaperone DnaJ